MDSAYDGTGRQHAWDSTSLGRFDACPRLYYYQNVMGYQPKEQSVHLRFGILAHKGLEIFERAKAEGLDHEEALHKMVREIHKECWNFQSDNNYKTKVTLMRLLVWHVDTFRDDALKPIVFPDGRAAVELSFRFNLTDDILICGHLDKITTINEEVYTKDLKTTKSALGSMYFDQFSPHIQMPIYTIAGKIVYKQPIKGVIIDAAQILVNGVRFQRAPLQYTQAWLDEFMIKIKHDISLAKQYHDANFWPMRPSSCHKYGGCEFRGVCSRSPDVRELFLKDDFVIERWDPLKIRGDAI